MKFKEWFVKELGDHPWPDIEWLEATIKKLYKSNRRLERELIYALKKNKQLTASALMKETDVDDGLSPAVEPHVRLRGGVDAVFDGPAGPGPAEEKVFKFDAGGKDSMWDQAQVAIQDLYKKMKDKQRMPYRRRK